jgi:multiple sugar transport system permease protein
VASDHADQQRTVNRVAIGSSSKRGGDAKLGKRRRFLRRRHVEGLFVTAVLLLATLVFLFPIIMIVATSFKAPIDILALPPRWVFEPTLENYEALLGFRPSAFHFDLPLHFRNSVLASGGTTVLSLVLATPAAYAFARLEFRGRHLGLITLLALRMLPPIATVIPLFLLMRNLHLLDTIPGLILAYTTFNLPFIVWLMRSFFLDLPKALEDASLIDGATHWQAFRLVMLPLCGPGLVASAIFGLMLAWNDFIFAIVLTNRDATTLPVLASGFITDMGTAWGIMMAAGTVIVMPVLIFTLFIQRYLVEGLGAGAVKG